MVQSFKVNPHYGGAKVTFIGSVELKKEKVVRDIEYLAIGEEILTDRFRDELDKAFAEFIELALTR